MPTNPDDLAICATCSTQFDVPYASPPPNCKICDDPRQFVPATGQAWTCMRRLRDEGHRNAFTVDGWDGRVVWFRTEPAFGIGQRGMILRTEHGNVLWDIVCYLDANTVEKIKELGGLKAIVISHPHYYAAHLEWAKAFDCPVYLAKDDEEWLVRAGDESNTTRKFITATTEVLPGVTAIKAGGHFPGSLLLHWENKLFIADTIFSVPSGRYHKDRPPGTISYAFMWSYPNMIPLPPDPIQGIWKALEPFDFDTTYGAFSGHDVQRKDAKKAILESMKIQIRHQGFEEHSIFDMHCD